MITGIITGFYGYLFPGNINLMMLELYHTKRFRVLIMMIVLALVFESLYCGMVLFLINEVKTSSWYSYITHLSYLLIFIMGSWMLFEKKKAATAKANPTIYRGILSILIHPQQIPFWTVTGVLIHSMRLLASHKQLVVFIASNAIGVLLIMTLYMVAGEKILNTFHFKMHQINKIIGSVYVFMSLHHFSSFIYIVV